MKTLILFALLLPAASAQFVQSNIAAANGVDPAVGMTLTLPAGTQAASLLVCGAGSASTGVGIAISDDHASSYTVVTPATYGPVPTSTYMFYLPNAAAGITTITFTPSSSAGIRATCMEVSGRALTNPLDGTAQTDISSSFTSPATWTGPSITTTAPGDFIVSMTEDANSNTFSPGSGWTSAFGTTNVTTYGGFMEYQAAASVGTYTSTGSASAGGNDYTVTVVLAFKAAASSAPSSAAGTALLLGA